MALSLHHLSTSLFGALLMLALIAPIESLSTTPTSDSPPVKRVAIIGSGIAGLSLAHALTNSPELAKSTPGSKIEVTLFDSRPSFDFDAGAGVQLNGGKPRCTIQLNVSDMMF